MCRSAAVDETAALEHNLMAMPTGPNLNLSNSIGAIALSLALVASALQGCASTTDAAKQLNPDPPGKMFADADALLTAKKYDAAAKRFEDLDRDHPYAPEARRAVVLAAFAYYKDGKFDQAIATARRYTTLHPGTKEAALAHHIIASSHFEEIRSPDRDQSNTRKALAELKTLKARYPDSSYAKEADNRIRICEDSLAASEMHVGREYLKKKAWVAAKNRFEIVVRDYQTTVHVEEGLARLVEVNMALGLVDEAQNAGAVLGHNFPDSRWYKDSYTLLASGGLAPREDTGNWISRQWRQVKLPKLSLGGPAQ